MIIKHWQLIWTLLNALWLIAWASPMVMIQLRGDTYQLKVYLGTWISMFLIPTLAVYVVGLVCGIGAASAVRGFDKRRATKWQGYWLLVSIGWAVLVGAFILILNPLHRFSMPLAVSVVLIIAFFPPALLYVAGQMIAWIRRGMN